MEPQMEMQENDSAAQANEQQGSNDAYERLLKEHEELRDKYMRIYADFDNFRKRALKEKADLMRTAAQDTLTALLPVLDDFDRAKSNSEVTTEGIQLVYNKLFSTLRNIGLEAMDTVDQQFDPEFHEAITEVPVPDDSRKGKIVDTVEKGYKLGDKIIRYAKVVVGK